MNDNDHFSFLLCRELEIKAPEYDRGTGYYTMDFRDFSIRCKDIPFGAYWQTEIGELPEERRETLLMSLMHYHLLGIGTGKGVFGFDEERKRLTFSLCADYRSDYPTFKEITEHFVNYADYWKGELQKAEKGEPSVLTK